MRAITPHVVALALYLIAIPAVSATSHYDAGKLSSYLLLCAEYAASSANEMRQLDELASALRVRSENAGAAQEEQYWKGTVEAIDALGTLTTNRAENPETVLRAHFTALRCERLIAQANQHLPERD